MVDSPDINTHFGNETDRTVLREAIRIASSGQRSSALASSVRETIGKLAHNPGQLPTDPEKLRLFREGLELAKVIDLPNEKPKWNIENQNIQTEVFDQPLSIDGYSDDVQIRGFRYDIESSKRENGRLTKSLLIFTFFIGGNEESEVFQRLSGQKSVLVDLKGASDKERRFYLKKLHTAPAQSGAIKVGYLVTSTFQDSPVPVSLYPGMDHTAGTPIDSGVVKSIFENTFLVESYPDELKRGSVGGAGKKTRR